MLIKWNIIFNLFFVLFNQSLSRKKALFGARLHNNLVADSMRQFVLLNIWRCRCLSMFSNQFIHHVTEILKFYFDTLFQIVFICSQLEGVAKNNSKINYFLNYIKFQVLQHLKKVIPCSRQLQSFFKVGLHV